MKILYFNRSFYPDIEATGQLTTSLCESLSNYGHKITVVSGIPYHNYINNFRTKGFINFDNYNAIQIIRVGGFRLPKRFLLFRIINLALYFTLAFISGFLIKYKPDLIITQTDPPVSGLLGIFFAKWYRAKFVYYCQDIYPEVGIVTGKLRNPIINFLLEKINLLSFHKADKIICLGETMLNKIANKGVEKNKIEVVYNWADTTKFIPIDKEKNDFIKENNLENIFTIMYAGNIGLTQNLDKLLEVMLYFKENKKIKFLLVGEGALKTDLQHKSKELGLSNVLFFPYKHGQDLVHCLNAASIHLVPFQKGLSGILVPSKIYNILACRRPFIGWIDNDSEIAKISSDYKCGIIAPAGDINGLVKAIERAVNNSNELEQMGLNGRKAVIENFDINISTSKFQKILNSLI